MEDLGAISLVPTIVVFTLAIITHRPIESLISGSIVGLIIINGDQFIVGFAETSVRVMMDEDVAWVILVCGFMGSLIGILIRTGSTSAFTEVMGQHVKSQICDAIFRQGFSGRHLYHVGRHDNLHHRNANHEHA